jgi:molybdopterin-guanine dinucleotide biosynthesis protein A
MDDNAGIILVGGLSKRYGKPKALEKIDGKTFFEIVFHELSLLTDEILVSYSDKTPKEVLELADRLGGTIVKDRDLPCYGPPRGLSSIAANESLRHESYWIVAVDYPYINASILGKLAEISRETGVDAVSPLLPGGYPAVTIGYIKYSSLEALLKSCINRRDLTRTTDLYRGSRYSMYIGWSILSDSFKPFVNVNNPEMLSGIPIAPMEHKIVVSDGKLFLRALDYIIRHELVNAAYTYMAESEQYEALGLTLLSIHARKDTSRLLSEIRKITFLWSLT